MFEDYRPWRGLIFPVVFITIGAACIATRIAWIPGRHVPGGMTLHGEAGLVMGAMFIVWGVGLYLRNAPQGAQPLGNAAETAGLVLYLAALAAGLWLLGIAFAQTFR